jgi:hypothetical protein
MKLLPIHGGIFAEIDDEDFDRLSKFKWHLSKRKNGSFYVVRNQRFGLKTKVFYLHREIMYASTGLLIDHRDRNVLNNKKSNLRFCTQSQNLMNRKRPQNCKEKYRGIYKDGNKWGATIKFGGKCIKLGYFYSPEEAAKVRDEAAIKYHGEFAVLNFPQFGSKI